MAVELYMVGGAVRDKLMGKTSKDIDFSVVADSWGELINWLDDNGFTRFVTTPEYLTVRAHFPEGYSFNGEDVSKLTADFVLARKEGSYYDGRHPESVEPGTLADDLRRRDFSVNALALDKDGNLIDLFGGVEDLRWKRLRAVGSAEARFREDALRAIRAIRFSITKGLVPDDDIILALDSAWLPSMVRELPIERIQQELEKCFRYNTLQTLTYTHTLTRHLQAAIFRNGLWLLPTLRN